MSDYFMAPVVNKINKYFSWSEFACNDNNEVLANKEVCDFIEGPLTDFRIWYNRPIIPSSGYRTPSWNKAKGGAKFSQHLKGLACDIHYPKGEYMDRARQDEFLDNVKTKWFELCDKYGVKGAVFYYNWGFHLDVRNEPNEYRVHRDYRS